MASFAEEMAQAARRLNEAADKLSRSAGGGVVGGGSGALGGGGGAGGFAGIVGGLAGGRGFLAAAGPAGAALAGIGMAADAGAAGARFLTPAANAYASTGSSQSFASAVTQSTLGAIQSTAIGGLALAATGVSAAMETNQRAGQSVLSVTEDLARIGVNVSDAQRQRLFDVNQEQEKRVTEERAKVAAIAGSAAELNDAKPTGAGAGFDSVVSAIQSLETTVRGLVGGGR